MLGLACTANNALAKGPCDYLTGAEAARLLGVAVGKLEPQAGSGRTSCIIHAADGSDGTLKIAVRTVSGKDTGHLRQHMDEERGGDNDGDEPWYELSAADPRHPHDRRLVIHRERTTLTLDLHSTHQADAKTAFESVWHEIAERLAEEDHD
jgi:hypothetical protein